MFFKAYTRDSEQAIVYVGRFSFSIYLVSEAHTLYTKVFIHLVYSNMILRLLLLLFGAIVTATELPSVDATSAFCAGDFVVEGGLRFLKN